jgi:hypothetical protein
VRSHPFGRKAQRWAAFFDDFREPGRSEKTALETTMPAAPSYLRVVRDFIRRAERP